MRSTLLNRAKDAIVGLKHLSRKKIALSAAGATALVGLSLLGQVPSAISNPFSSPPLMPFVIDEAAPPALMKSDGFPGWNGNIPVGDLVFTSSGYTGSRSEGFAIHPNMLDDPSGLYTLSFSSFTPSFGSNADGGIFPGSGFSSGSSGDGGSVEEKVIIIMLPPIIEPPDAGKNAPIPTPEPSTFLLMGAGLAGVALIRRKYHRKNK